MYKRILVPLDGSPLSEQALPHGIAHAERFGAELILLRVLEPLPGLSMASPARKQAEEWLAEQAREYLQAVSADIEEDIHVELAVSEGRPYLEIVRFADDSQVDLIVMSTRGQSGLSRWLLGSVTDRVVRGATVPVLLVCAPRPGAG
jgi:nucleotide-binding universal stress UspA family protein